MTKTEKEDEGCG